MRIFQCADYRIVGVSFCVRNLLVFDSVHRPQSSYAIQFIERYINKIIMCLVLHIKLTKSVYIEMLISTALVDFG